MNETRSGLLFYRERMKEICGRIYLIFPQACRFLVHILIMNKSTRITVVLFQFNSRYILPLEQCRLLTDARSRF